MPSIDSDAGAGTPYFELHAHSAFHFQVGVDRPEEMVNRAHALGYSGITLLDRDGFYGAVRTNRAGREAGISVVQGCEITLADGTAIPILATGPQGYSQLCQLLSEHNLKYDPQYGPAPALTWAQLREANQGDWFALSGGHGVDQRLDMAQRLRQLCAVFGPDRVAVEACLSGDYGDQKRARDLAALARDQHLPLVATSGAVAADSRRRDLAQVASAIANRETLAQTWGRVGAAPPYLLARPRLGQIFAPIPQALTAAVQLGRDCAFDLQLIAPQLPKLELQDGHTPDSWLRHLVNETAVRRYGSRTANPHAWEVIDYELEIITATGFASYFLIVNDIVQFCKSNDILCQGRGSAANSAVCYGLGITAVDAVKHQMLFARFLTPDRREYPDIDLDIEAGRRPEVIQYVYSKYGRHNCAQVANVIEYKPRSAIADAARVLGYDPGAAAGWSRLRDSAAAQQDPSLALPADVNALSQQLRQLPRHLGLHSGGMIVSDQPLSRIGVIRWAATAGRSMLEWDKDDCADIGLVKIDLLGLGMLSALRRAFNALAAVGIRGADGQPLGLHNIGDDDPAVYDLLCAADTVGVFQVESRAQMSTLPRLQPRTFYDIVVEVALIRPGPIQGQAVNPYLRRRQGREAVTYLHPLLRPALEKTLGVPLFQEQLMRIATDVAGFSPTQADQLRRAMGAKRSREEMEKIRAPLFAGMAKRGIGPALAAQIWEQLLGFAKFGFPESHAFSFAYIVYASAWLKVHYPAFFYAALIASQPMGFYSVQDLVQDALQHGVAVASPCVVCSGPTTTVVKIDGAEAATRPCCAPDTSRPVQTPLAQRQDHAYRIQLGLDLIRGWSEADCTRVCTLRDGDAPTIAAFAAQVRLGKNALEQAASGGALRYFEHNRARALWSAGPAAATKTPGGEWHQTALALDPAPAPHLDPPPPAHEIAADLGAIALSTTAYPTSLVRPHWQELGYLTAAELPHRDGERVWVAGVVTHRQRPGSAKGVVFLSLRDETGVANIICSPGIWQRYRICATVNPVLAVRGIVRNNDGSVTLSADKIRSERALSLGRARDFR